MTVVISISKCKNLPHDPKRPMITPILVSQPEPLIRLIVLAAFLELVNKFIPVSPTLVKCCNIAIIKVSIFIRLLSMYTSHFKQKSVDAV